MSIPINHHHVSQCQIGNFFNQVDKKIYLYDKVLQNHFNSKSTKRVFSEDEANSRITNNQLDHSSLEKDLNDNFEKTFTKHLAIISNVIATQKATPDFKDALVALTKYGIAGELRPPTTKKESDEVIYNALFNVLLPNAAPELKQELEVLKAKTEQTKYSNTIEYSEFADKVFNSMGDISCILYVIKSDHYFILPDRPSITKREKINEYFNPDIKEIAMVGVPLSSKIFLHSESQKLRKYDTRIVELTENDIHTIDRINFCLYQNAFKIIACENKNYLANFISRVGSLSA